MPNPKTPTWWVIIREPNPASMEIVTVEPAPADPAAAVRRCAELFAAQQRACVVTATDEEAASDAAMSAWRMELVTDPKRLAAATAHNAAHPRISLSQEEIMHETDMMCVNLVNRLDVTMDAARSALDTTLHRVHIESHDPRVANAGLTPADYLTIALRTPRFAAMHSAGALRDDGREADARLSWEAYLEREMTNATGAHQAVPATAPLGDPQIIHQAGRNVGLSDEYTDALIPHLVLRLARGYPFRGPDLRDLTLTDVLAMVTVEDLGDLLWLAAVEMGARPDEAATELDRILPKRS
ncbi:hypothetical protein ABZ858_00460 [Streptomyces sp. NPDC047017]|uniref:hypothetical protein n=1 Tax=Streptomyces sp. NPDC047017 TaxID=3155024 RepID=UPI0033D12F51